MDIQGFIAKWQGIKGGAERANYAQFINDFCQALGLPEPEVAESGKLGNYQFEGPVQGGGAGGSTGAIDLYKKGHFILEAKQSKLTAAQQQQPELFDAAETAPATPSGARYDRLMRDALAQAKRYAVNLPADHPWPPFLIVCDVGRAFELYFDWSGNGRGYGYFPDQQSYRIDLHSLASDQPLKGVDRTPTDLLAAIWTNPASVDPRAKSAEVSREIAKRLADVSKWLEETQKIRTTDALDRDRSLAIEETALFLMRVIFCMFAEDVGLLPKRSFTDFLGLTLEREAAFEPELRNLWQIMGRPDGERYASAVGAEVRYFNGGLFESAQTYSLSLADRGELYEAAKADWTKVEPAIFGTLLEQALTAKERAKLGAHYTPRAYVERLVQATIMDVLDAEWDAIIHSSPLAGEEGGASAPEGEGAGAQATQKINAPQTRRDPSPHPLPPQPLPQVERELTLQSATSFHARLAALRILDPACGTGNFLYVAMENLMRLESDVVETIRQLGGQATPVVGPHQFLGLELNARAAVIAELVLWIGWLRWRMKNDPDAAPDPVLQRGENINFGTHGGYDAVLRRTPTGEPDIDNPMQPDWPQADFIVGNPPFIGGKDIRRNLGGDYAEALWAANPRVPKSADFVMQWWDRAAHALVAPDSPLIRFGFVTTNSITQTFSRRVIENYLAKNPSPLAGEGGAALAAEGEGAGATAPQAKKSPPAAASDLKPSRQKGGGLSLILAIPDHPWTKATKDAAAVRIAMTVAERGEREGRLVEIISERGLDSDEPVLTQSERIGRINPDMKLGADVTAAKPLMANDGLATPGVKLHGAGFIITPAEAVHLGLGKREGLEKHVRPYRNGRDLLQRSRDVMVIDLFGLDEKEVRQRFPEVYQHLLTTVKPERDINRRESYKRLWWIHGEPRKDLRPALHGLTRYIATVETARHRAFQFVDADVLPDNKIIVLCLDNTFEFGVLASEIHQQWTFARCGLIGMASFEAGHVYVKSNCFDPFPFPDATPEQRTAIADLAEELDATRKAALAEVPGLTMTEIYNLREKLRSGATLDLAEQDRARAARAGIVNRLHEQIDEAVAAAYGWPADLPPSEIVARLVELNAERAAEEKAGTVRWLRPDYQIPRFGTKKP